MISDSDIKHEIVNLTDPLPVWVFYHHKEVSYVAPHWHRGIELSYTLEGRIDDFTIGNTHYQTNSKQILVVNSQEIHSVRNHSTGKALSIIFPYPFVERLYPSIKDVWIEINDYNGLNNFQRIKYAQLQALLEQCIQLYLMEENQFKMLNLYITVIEILKILLESFCKKRSTNPSQKLGEKDYTITRMQKITKYVNDNYQQSISLQNIADEVNLTKEYLAKFFKKHFDLTVGQYVNNVRAQHAHEQLSNSTLNLTQIAIDSGFSGIRTMNRSMKSLYGKTASQIYKEYRKGDNHE